MALCMATSYEPQVAQMNEEPTSESFLDLTLMQCNQERRVLSLTEHPGNTQIPM
jgi:hypothetical protein